VRIALEQVDRICQRAAMETLQGGAGRPWRVVEFRVENVDHADRIDFRVYFTRDGSGEEYFLRRSVSQYELARYRDHEPPGYADCNVSLAPVVVQELYEAHLNVLEMQQLTPPPSERETATAMRMHYERARMAGDHLDRIRQDVMRNFERSASERGMARRERDFYSRSIREHLQQWSAEMLTEATMREMVASLTQMEPRQQQHYLMDFVPQQSRWKPEAIAQGWKLLRDNLSPEQLSEFNHTHKKGKGHFHCIGGTTRKIYRIVEGTQQNVYEFTNDGKPVRGICFLPEGDLVIGDVMLAQKVALELDELRAIRVAIPFDYGVGAQRRISDKRLKDLLAVINGEKKKPSPPRPKKAPPVDNPIRRGRLRDWWMN
jgi:hypothetical protein